MARFVGLGRLAMVESGYVVADWQSVFPKDWTAAARKRRWREGLVTELRFDLPESIVETIAERAAALVLERLDGSPRQPELLSVPEAAELLRCSRQRVYDLLSAGRLERLKDGSRVLVRRADVIAHVSGEQEIR